MTSNTPEELMKLSLNFMGSRILFSGAELNIFDILDRTSLTVQEISDKLHTDIRATTILLDALAAMGLLVKSSESYQCAPSLAPYLSNDDPNSIMPMILHASHLWHRRSHLTDIVRGETKSDVDRGHSFSVEGMLNRVSLVGGDYLRDEIPQGHDLAFLSAIIHSNSPEQNINLYKKVFRSLIPGGRIIIRDHVMESDRINSEEGAIFAVNMLIATEGGRTYTFDEIRTDLSQAGFNNIRLLKKSDRMDAIIEAYKL